MFSCLLALSGLSQFAAPMQKVERGKEFLVIDAIAERHIIGKHLHLSFLVAYMRLYTGSCTRAVTKENEIAL